MELTLTGITENYMFTRLYLPRAQLESLLGTEDIPWNTVYGQTTCTDAAGYNALRTDLLDCNYVSSISFTGTPPSCSITSSSVWAMWWC